MSNKRSLVVENKKALKDAFKDIQKELVGEHVEMVRDYIKGVYRLRHEYEGEVSRLQKEIESIDEVLDKSESKGDMEVLKEIKVPAKYLSERTVRLANMDWDE